MYLWHAGAGSWICARNEHIILMPCYALSVSDIHAVPQVRLRSQQWSQRPQDGRVRDTQALLYQFCFDLLSFQDLLPCQLHRTLLTSETKTIFLKIGKWVVLTKNNNNNGLEIACRKSGCLAEKEGQGQFLQQISCSQSISYLWLSS